MGMAGVRIVNGWLKRLSRNELMALPLAVSLASLLGPAALAAPAKTVCPGTLLQLAVQEQAVSDIDRFRFSLGLSGEGASEAAALQQLNQRLKRLRRDLTPLIVGQLTVPAPRSHQQGRSDDKRFVARTTFTGEVEPSHYNALIQLAGRRVGVQLQGMQPKPKVEPAVNGEKQALKRALDRGLEQAQWIGQTIGRRTVRLQTIERRGAVRSPLLRSAASAVAFDPNEAPKPQISVHLQLTYCLS